MKNNMMKLNLEQMATVNGGTCGETRDDFLRFHSLGKRDLYKGWDDEEKEDCLIDCFYPYGVYISIDNNGPNKYYLMSPKTGPFGDMTPLTRDQAWDRVYNNQKMFDM